MFDISLTEEQQFVAETARTIAMQVVAPAARTAEGSGAVPVAVWTALLQTGLTQPVAEEFGGSGVPDTVTQLIAAENFAYGDPGITIASLWNGAVASLLAQHGAATHRPDLDALLSDPTARIGLALYEGYGRGATELATTIQDAGDSVRITGRKVGVPFASTATSFLVVGTEPASGEVRLAVVPRSAAGVAVQRTSGWLALEAADLGTVDLDTTVPLEHLVGGADADPVSVRTSLQRVRLLVAAVQLGAAQRSVDYASRYATERVAFGQPISTFQGVAFPLAESQMQLAQLRLEIAEAASRLDTEVFDDHTRSVTAAVSYAADVAPEASRTAVQTLGGHGFIKDHPVEIWYRSCAALSTLDFDPVATAFAAAL